VTTKTKTKKDHTINQRKQDAAKEGEQPYEIAKTGALKSWAATTQHVAQLGSQILGHLDGHGVDLHAAAAAVKIRSNLGPFGPGRASICMSWLCLLGSEAFVGISRVMRKPGAAAPGMVVVVIFFVEGGRPGW
jgi:hypothetical protein